MQIDRDKTKWKEGEKNSCMSFTPCYFHLLLSPFSSTKSFLQPFFPPGHCHCYPQVFCSFAQKASNSNSLSENPKRNATYCSTAAQSEIITATGKDNVCLLVWFSGDGCALRPHGSAIVAGGWLPSGSGTETKRLFSSFFYQASELTDSLVFYSVAASWLYCSDSNCDIDGILSVVHWTA